MGMARHSRAGPMVTGAFGRTRYANGSPAASRATCATHAPAPLLNAH